MHTRGRLLNARIYRYVIGTTHAHAGQTGTHLHTCTVQRNHPCTRGADLGSTNLIMGWLEPPMHTRGRLPFRGGRNTKPGTTHAHAGQTPTASA